jgi:phosphate transport system protein
VAYRAARRLVAAIPPAQRRATYRTPGAPTPAAAVHKPHGQAGSWPSSSCRRRSTKLSVSGCPVVCACWYTSIANLSLLADQRPTVSVCPREAASSLKCRNGSFACAIAAHESHAADLRVVSVREGFQQDLRSLTSSIAEMCEQAGLAMQRATQALLQADLELAEQVITELQEIAPNVAGIEDDALRLLALQAPVAGDLRAVVSSLKNVADVQRMHALAMHVARMARRRHPSHAVPEDVNGYFAEMGRIAVDIGNEARDVVLSSDPSKAAQLDDDDDSMDELHRNLFTMLMDQDWRHGVAAAVDVTLLGRYYERFADHAVEIARRVIFQATGQQG